MIKSVYRTKYLPGHPRANILGFVPVHILIAEKKLGRSLRRSKSGVIGEVVHHRDFCKVNNDPNNLVIMTRMQHQRIPELQVRFLIEKGLIDTFFIWWEKNKDKTDSLREMQYALAAAEETKMQMEIRHQKQQAKKDDDSTIY